jgi:signal transduction histidine kinase
MLIALLEVCKIAYNKDSMMAEQKLSEAAEVARGGLKELRESLYQIKSEGAETKDCISKLQSLIEGFRLTGIEIELVAEVMDNMLQPIHSEVIYKICREALTNSLRHGKAEHISIILKPAEDRVKLFILDDGYGCVNINKGLGLAGMEERIEEVKGSIVYGSDGEKGFNIHVEIPIGGVSK